MDTASGVDENLGGIGNARVGGAADKDQWLCPVMMPGYRFGVPGNILGSLPQKIVLPTFQPQIIQLFCGEAAILQDVGGGCAGLFYPRLFVYRVFQATAKSAFCLGIELTK